MAKKQITSKHCPVVAIIWKKGSIGADSTVAIGAVDDAVHVLIVLTGNGNDRYTKVCGYDYIINVTWAANHESNPTWLPAYLLYMKRAIVCRFGGMCHVDVLGLSRGHSALMYCCDKTSNNSYMQLATEFNYWMAAAGCVWQQSDQGIVANIWEGLRDMATAR